MTPSDTPAPDTPGPALDPQATGLLVVDVCGTLYDATTSAGFARHHARRTGCAPALLGTLETLRRPALRGAIIAAGRAARRDLFRAWHLRLLKGASSEALRLSAEGYLDALTPRRIGPAHDRLARLTEAGWSPILVSNSLDAVIGPLAGRMGLPWLASELDYDAAGRCTGRLARDLTGRKLATLTAHLGGLPARLAVLTDNRSDGDVIARADPAILVARGRPAPWMEVADAEILSV